jgi:RNA polymerase sigma factor (sigma-70 family)
VAYERGLSADDVEPVDLNAHAPAVSERASFVAFYRQEYVALVRTAFLLAGSQVVAEDLVQDALARMWPRWASIEHPGSYAQASVVNGWRGLVRRRRVSDPLTDVEDVRLSGDLLELRGALDLLPARQRAAIVLRFHLGSTDVEIAEVLGCRPATARSLVHRGLARLREVIEL